MVPIKRLCLDFRNDEKRDSYPEKPQNNLPCFDTMCSAVSRGLLWSQINSKKLHEMVRISIKTRGNLDPWIDQTNDDSRYVG